MNCLLGRRGHGDSGGKSDSDLGDIIRARNSKRLPVVLTVDEAKAVLGQLTGDKWLMVALLYGSGLRLMECLRLRVQDLDFANRELLVRDSKGGKDRRTMLPETLIEPLKEHLEKVRALHAKDLQDGWGRVCPFTVRA